MEWRTSVVTAAFVAVVSIVLLYASVGPSQTVNFSPELKAYKSRGKDFMFKASDGVHKIKYWIDEGTGPRDTLILLHGFPTSAYDYMKIMPDLKKIYKKIVSFDFIGFGFSDKPYDHKYSVLEQADIAEALAEHLGIKEAAYMAHDYGTTVMQELMYRQQQGEAKVRQTDIGFFNGGIFPYLHNTMWQQKALLNPYLGPFFTRIMNRFMFQRSFSEVFGPNTKPTDEEIQEIWAVITYKEGTLVYDKLITYLNERNVYGDRWVKTLLNVDVPAVMMNGPADPVSGRQAAEEWGRKLDAKKAPVHLMENDVGHYPQWEDPEQSMKLYTGWLKSFNAI
eukprot:Clim_evm28s230 gene=Clim_evmTU28s230